MPEGVQDLKNQSVFVAQGSELEILIPVACGAIQQIVRKIDSDSLLVAVPQAAVHLNRPTQAHRVGPDGARGSLTRGQGLAVNNRILTPRGLAVESHLPQNLPNRVVTGRINQIVEVVLGSRGEVRAVTWNQ